MALSINPFDHGCGVHTDTWKTQGLKQALDGYRFDVTFGGARRDEEKSRAKERILSFRTSFHAWNPKKQRPELWSSYNGVRRRGESMRAIALSDWAELVVWRSIHQENTSVGPLYFAVLRPGLRRASTWLMVHDKRVRFLTVGFHPLSVRVESEAESEAESDADSVPTITEELPHSRSSERQGRITDHDGSASIKRKKQEGYF